jgi:hypothetical protein
VKHRTTQSALLVAGAAAGVAALAWVGRRRHAGPARPEAALDSDTLPGQDDEQTAVRRRPQPSQRDPGADGFVELASEDLIEAERPELPIGRSADPAIDDELRFTGERDETSGALFSEPEPDRPVSEDISLEQIWDAVPRTEEEPPTEGYDAVAPEDLGSVWLERATETAREDRLYTSDPAEPAALDELMVSEATRASALPLDAEDAETEAEDNRVTRDDEQDPNDVQEDDLDIDEKRDSRP